MRNAIIGTTVIGYAVVWVYCICNKTTYTSGFLMGTSSTWLALWVCTFMSKSRN